MNDTGEAPKQDFRGTQVINFFEMHRKKWGNADLSYYLCSTQYRFFDFDYCNSLKCAVD